MTKDSLYGILDQAGVTGLLRTTVWLLSWQVEGYGTLQVSIMVSNSVADLGC
jgi:hypothetical protein